MRHSILWGLPGRRFGRVIPALAVAGLLAPLATLADPSPSGAVLVCGTDAELVAVNGHERVRGTDWTLGQPIDVTVARPGEDPYLDTQIGPFEDSGCGAFQLEVLIEGDGRLLEPGDVVTATQGAETRTLTVDPVEVVLVDFATDTAYGTAPAGAEVDVAVERGFGRDSYTVTANGEGNWVHTDPVGLTDDPGTGILASLVVHDPNAYTEAQVPIPSFDTFWGENRIELNWWPPGSFVDVTIDDPYASFVDIATIVGPNLGMETLGAAFHADSVITGTSPTAFGPWVRVLEVETLTVNIVDNAGDLVSGDATPGSTVAVAVYPATGSGVEHWVTADATTGEWQADFSGGPNATGVVYDLRPEDSGEAYVAVPGGQLHARWGNFGGGEPGGPPALNVQVNVDSVAGFNWPEGAMVHLEIDDPATTGEGFEPDLEMEAQVGSDGNVGFWFADRFDVQAGHEVTMTDGETETFHIVQSLEVTEVDADLDMVRGTADPDDEIWVNTTNLPDNAQRLVTANANGDWEADFSVPGVGEEQEEQQVTADLAPGVQGGALEGDPVNGTDTEFTWYVPNPTFAVETPFEVFSTNPDALTPGDVVDVYVNASEDRSTFDHHETVTVVDHGWGPQFNVSTGPFEVTPTHVVTVDYPSGDSKSLLVVDLTLESIDDEGDTVSGTASAGTAVSVHAGNEFGGSRRDVVADEFGGWTAEFAVPPEEAFDLASGVGGAAQVYDDDGDSTHRGFCIEPCGGGEPGGPPELSVHVNGDSVEGFNWPDGAMVHLEIDDPATTGDGFEPDFEMDVPVGENDVGSDGNVGFSFADRFDVQAGHEVTMTDGETETFHIVQSVEVTEVDTELDMVRGTADPDDEIWVITRSESEEAIRLVTANSEGEWTADFSVPGTQEQGNGVADLIRGTEGAALEGDLVNGNETTFTWRVPNPQFFVSPLFGDISGHEWIEGAEAIITVDDPATIESPDIELSSPIERFNPWEQPGFYVWVDPSEFVLEPGHVVTVTDGETFKTHEVTSLTVSGADATADTVSGSAAAGSDVEVFAHSDEGGAERRATVDAGGTWTADFSTGGPDEEPIDLQPGMAVGAMQSDDDGDATTAHWELIEQRLTADQFDDVVWLGWPETGVPFDVRISALGDGSTWTTSATTEQVGEFRWETGLLLDLYLDGRDVVTGTLVELIDPGTQEVVRSLEVSPLTVTQLDPDDDGTVHGVATPGSTLNFEMDNSTGSAWRVVEVDGAGDWITHPGHDPGAHGQQGEGIVEDVGLRFEAGVNVEQLDEDGDATVVRWGNYRIAGVAAMPDTDVVSGTNWTGLWPATLTIENELGDVLYEQTDIPIDRGPSALEIDGEPVFFDAPDWENHFAVKVDIGLRPGHRVIVTDGLYTGLTIVSEIAITQVDLASDVISGTATPGDFVLVFVMSSTPGEQISSFRATCTEADGGWEVNFGEALVGPLEFACLPEGAAPALDTGDVMPRFDLDHSTVTRGFASTTDSDDPFGNNPDDDDGTNLGWWPHLTDLAATPEVAEAGVAEVAFSALVDATDPTDPRRHAVGATVDWGDGTTTVFDGTDLVPDADGDIALAASHTYTTPDVETILLTVEFADGHVEIEAYHYVAVYDPDAGFVTGAGWISSPAGAYTAEPDLEGDARFGFVSRYRRGANTPTGNTVFEFRMADLRFASTSYDWMVVAGHDRAKFKGEGTVNGESGFSFMLTAIDGDPDTFRIKIWDEATDEVVYDNNEGTEITRGSIVVHTK